MTKEIKEMLYRDCAVLEGTKRQIKWASDIQDDACSCFNSTARFIQPRCTAKEIAAINEYISKSQERASAKWWIDNKDEFNFNAFNIRNMVGAKKRAY